MIPRRLVLHACRRIAAIFRLISASPKFAVSRSRIILDAPRDCVPTLADSVEQIVRSIMETGEPVTGIEVVGQRTDQPEKRTWITYWHPLRVPSGEIVAVNVAAEEITARKRSEREMLRAREAAEQALERLRETQAICHPYARARARPWSRCYGVAPQRDRSRQNR
jgi:hypothetical protein